MREAEKQLMVRVSKLEAALSTMASTMNHNFEVLQESSMVRSVESAVFQRVIVDLDRKVVYSSGGVTVETPDAYRTADGAIDFPRYELEYHVVLGLQGFVEAHAAWKAKNPDPEPPPEPQADYVFGGG